MEQTTSRSAVSKSVVANAGSEEARSAVAALESNADTKEALRNILTFIKSNTFVVEFLRLNGVKAIMACFPTNNQLDFNSLQIQIQA